MGLRLTELSMGMKDGLSASSCGRELQQGVQCPSQPRASDGDIMASIRGTGLGAMQDDAGGFAGNNCCPLVCLHLAEDVALPCCKARSCQDDELNY